MAAAVWYTDDGKVPELTFGRRLRIAREDAGLDQTDMAALFGYSTATISNWENDVNQPRDLLNVVSRWSKITGVGQPWILGIRPESL